MEKKMLKTSLKFFPNPENFNKKTEGRKTTSLVKHITDTVNALITFGASLAVAFSICYFAITAKIILSLLKSLINCFSCRRFTPSPPSKAATVSPSRIILNRYSSQHERAVWFCPPSLESVVPAPKNTALPETSKKTLFLGLRRILVRFTFNPPCDQFDFVVHLLIKGKRKACYVIKRPGFDQFVRAAKSASFEVVIYTRWDSEYAGPIIDMLDPTGELITHRLYRNACTNKHGKGLFMKDLAMTGRNLDRSVIIDNNPRKHVKQWANSIAIRSFLGNHTDTELLHLVKFFEAAKNFSNLRELINITSFGPAISVLPLPSTDKKTLFLDLDHTLIYASTTQPNDSNYLVNHPYFIVKRRGVDELLHAAHWASFEIVIFTAASARYASPILNWLDPGNKYITHRLYRDACNQIDGVFYEKDLTTAGRRLEWSVIIDDNPKYVRPRENALVVRPFKGDSSDMELLNLLVFFDAQSRFNDIRIATKYVNSLLHGSSNNGQRKKLVVSSNSSN